MLTVSKQNEMSVQEVKAIMESRLREQVQAHEDSLQSLHKAFAAKVHETCTRSHIFCSLKSDSLKNIQLQNFHVFSTSRYCRQHDPLNLVFCSKGELTLEYTNQMHSFTSICQLIFKLFSRSPLKDLL
jgi:hypothetical protein